MKAKNDFVTFLDRWKELYQHSGLHLPKNQVVQMVVKNFVVGVSALLAINECTTLAQLHQKGHAIQQIFCDGTFNNALGLTRARRGSRTSTNVNDASHDQVVAFQNASDSRTKKRRQLASVAITQQGTTSAHLEFSRIL